jgi:4-hydroxy-tetrahydrodipicolinate synthase
MTTGGNGEFPHLLMEERKRVVEVVREKSPSQVPVIACVSACGSRESIILAKHAEDVGSDAVILTPPYYFRLPEDSVFEHYRLVADSVNIQTIVYNNPSYTGHNITPALMRRLVGIDGIIGMKQSHPDIGQISQILHSLSNKISILTGIDTQLFPTLCIGARGVFSTAACVYPRQMVDLYNDFMNGKIQEARKMHEKLLEANMFFEYDPGYVAPCKEALKMIGLPGGSVRSPMPNLAKSDRASLRRALLKAGLKLKR